jgi:hypothetical protein
MRRGEMRFFRLMAITVLLVACVVLGTACAGAKGEEGPQGPKGDTGAAGVGIQNIVNNGDGTFTVNLTDGTAHTTDNFTGSQGQKGDTGAQGAQGIQGVPGPNMIAAMGIIAADGTITDGYNVSDVTYVAGVYRIGLTGITYDCSTYVTVANLYATGTAHVIQTACYSGKLTVYIKDSAGNPVQGMFQFLVVGPI